MLGKRRKQDRDTDEPSYRQDDAAGSIGGAVPDQHRTEDNVPSPDHPIKPDSPTDLTKRSWFYVARKTVREFLDDQCTDLAAALTYYAVLALFPAMLAVISIFGVFGQGTKSVQTILDVLDPFISAKAMQSIEPTLTQLASTQTAGLALVIGLAGALWAASGYIRAFARAMNRVYEVREGRPFWKLIPQQLLLTVLSVLLCALVLVMLIVSGPVAESIGNVVGLGETTVQVWNIAKWPVLALIVILTVAVLYHWTPNVKQPKFRWLSIGAFLAIMVWVIASVGFAFYVANFSSYNKTYGSLAGIVVTLLWLWLTNNALLFGAELDAELERGRELQAGLPAEQELQLPVRDERGIVKAEKKEQEAIERGRRIREHAWSSGNPADRPFSRR
ncbi:MAG TPA: YihY/virulence factor BrkB family protein [Marmoricola sp.]|jgi:membrane protein|nr:YihY/virulence factor BrkB family protein [Marmoricola sp.]